LASCGTIRKITNPGKVARQKRETVLTHPRAWGKRLGYVCLGRREKGEMKKEGSLEGISRGGARGSLNLTNPFDLQTRQNLSDAMSQGISRTPRRKRKKEN